MKVWTACNRAVLFFIVKIEGGNLSDTFCNKWQPQFYSGNIFLMCKGISIGFLYFSNFNDVKKIFHFLILILLTFGSCGRKLIVNMEKDAKSLPQTAYTNPILWADVPDLSITRSGKDYYLISTTMHLMPGGPIMKSEDLVHWEPVSYVFEGLHDTSKYDLINGTVYGRGQWASSIRYHNGKYYVLFSPNDDPFSAYIYSTDDPSGNWELVSRMQHFHDASLFFDDDGSVYVFYGTGNITELEPDLSGVKKDGINTRLFERDEEETGLLEGSQVVKHNGKYYLLMISWPRNENRRQVCYRSDAVTGPYEKKVILEDAFAGFPYVGQGCIIDDINGNWYGLVFQDRGGVGRVPLLMPCRWLDGWPMLGDEQGHVPATGSIPLKSYNTGNRIVESDDFSSSKLKIQWQWNHNPIKEAWSLQERPGHLRLKTCRVVDNLYNAPNSLTQRMEGPTCSATVALDFSQMLMGDVAGMAAFNGHSGVLAVKKELTGTYLCMSTQVVELGGKDKEVKTVNTEEKERVQLSQNKIYLKIEADFNLNKDVATFYYSLNGTDWKKIGPDFTMVFDYRKLFMGTKFALFNYATENSGGFVDFDFFNYTHNNQ